MNIRLVDLDVDITFAADPEISILAAAEKAGRNEITAGCRGGGCGLCKVKILNGTYYAKKMSAKHVSAVDLECGITLACRTFPRTSVDVTINLNGSEPT